METIIIKIIAGLTAISIAFAGFLGFVPKKDLDEASQAVKELQIQVEEISSSLMDFINSTNKNLNNLGATIPVTVALFESSLASKISSTDTSLTLVSASTTIGTDLDGYMCFTIDEGTAVEEFTCGNASGTAITSLIRGVDPIDGDATNTTLMKEHRRGSAIKITNYPQLAIISRVLNGDETLPNILTYNSSPNFTAESNQLGTIYYIDTVATSGAAFASTTVAGILEIATADQILAGDATDTTGGYLVISTESMASTTQNASTSVITTNGSGKLNQDFLDLTSAFTFSGAVDFTGELIATSTLDVGGAFGASSTSQFFGNITATAATNTFGWTQFDTFIPLLPTATATEQYHIASKAYVDESTGLGTWSTSSVVSNDSTTTDSVRQAASDLLACVDVEMEDGARSVIGYADSNASPTTRIASDYAIDNNDLSQAGFCMPIKNTQFWYFDDSRQGQGTTTVSWIAF